MVCEIIRLVGSDQILLLEKGVRNLASKYCPMVCETCVVVALASDQILLEKGL